MGQGIRPTERVHTCDVCGTVGEWASGWAQWGSLGDMDEWGLDIVVCSRACSAALEHPQDFLDRKAAKMGLIRRGPRYKYPKSKKDRELLIRMKQ